MLTDIIQGITTIRKIIYGEFATQDGTKFIQQHAQK